jgi:Cu+-exporting ATPase
MPTQTARHATLTLEVKGMSCGSCEARVSRALAAIPGFHSARIDRAAERVHIGYDPTVAVQLEFATAIVAAGYSATLPPSPGAPSLTPPAVGPHCKGADEPACPDPEHPDA